jgi:chromate reductase, NAD(P)H dehydrogenase (quinone)
MHILALSGSLRQASINSALLRAAVRFAPSGASVTVFNGLGRLPLFNPDLEGRPARTVIRFRARVAAADALLIASPEYAHGVTGTIKNALDWLVSFEPFACKPVAVLNASARAHHADDALREILKTMAAIIVEPATVQVAPQGASPADATAFDRAVEVPIRASLAALCDAVRLHRASTQAVFTLS